MILIFRRFGLVVCLSGLFLLFLNGCFTTRTPGPPEPPPEPPVKKVIKKPEPPPKQVMATPGVKAAPEPKIIKVGGRKKVKPGPKEPKLDVTMLSPVKPRKPKEPQEKIIRLPEISVNFMIYPDNDTGRFLEKDDFVMKWSVLGPFKFNPHEFQQGKVNEAIHREFVATEKNLDGSEKPPKGARWQTFSAKTSTGKNMGKVDLDRLYTRDLDYAAAYAVTYIYSPVDSENLILYTGSDDFIKVWINGKLVHAYNRESREGKWDQDNIKGIKLKKGYNLVVVKCLDLEDNWNFYFRLATRKDLPIKIRAK